MTRPPTRRVLVESVDDGTGEVLAAALVILADGGSIVLCSPDLSGELDSDPERRRRIVDGERVTPV